MVSESRIQWRFLGEPRTPLPVDYDFLVSPDELTLAHRLPSGERVLGFTAGEDPRRWRERAVAKLTALLQFDPAGEPAPVEELREVVEDGVTVTALRMRVSECLSIPGYLLCPAGAAPGRRAVMALHGHGEVAEALSVTGVREDYHHHYAYRLAQAGHTVLVPELRRFGALYAPSAMKCGGRTMSPPSTPPRTGSAASAAR